MCGPAVMMQKQDKRLQERIVYYDPTTGVYATVLYLSGRWCPYVTDDRLPVRNSVHHEGKVFLVYAEPGDAPHRLTDTGVDVSLWFPMLEKAYAKAHLSYEAIDGGFGR